MAYKYFEEKINSIKTKIMTLILTKELSGRKIQIVFPY